MKLTSFSPGAGCGCKISSAVLQDILSQDDRYSKMIFPHLLVGNDTLDDAAVYDVGSGLSLISTTDFFTPIVDDPFDFGRIAATNAISDVYAMGGTPVMAIAILGFPLDKLPNSVAAQIINGAKEICHLCNIPLAGGHSIQISDPVFGLAVTGTIATAHVKRNFTVEAGDIIYLTKPLGIGLVTTAGKFSQALQKDIETAIELMVSPNKLGTLLAPISGVTALTDVTGFGLLGHLSEMVSPRQLTAEIYFKDVPTFGTLSEYIEKKCIPGGTERNYLVVQDKVEGLDDYKKAILCDPQTSGGLLFTVNPKEKEHVEKIARSAGIALYPIGKICNFKNHSILVR